MFINLAEVWWQANFKSKLVVVCVKFRELFFIWRCFRLKIVERHQHSVDIYTEENRYTPLGTDATVVFGYKDLRIRNPYHFPIQFWFSVEENHFIGELCSKEKRKLGFKLRNKKFGKSKNSFNYRQRQNYFGFSL
jgi:hypothetical protein